MSAVVLSNNLIVLLARVWNSLPTLADLSRTMDSHGLADGSRYM